MKKNTRLLNRIYGKKTIDKINKKFTYVNPSKIDMYTFLNFRLIISLVILLLVVLFIKIGFVLGPILAVLFYFGSEYFLLDYKIEKRIVKLEKDANYFFEVLLMVMLGGENFVSALNITAENVDDDLSKEFKRTVNDIKVSQNVKDSIDKMRVRIPSELLNTILININEANTYGLNMIDTLKKQIDYLSDNYSYRIRRVVNNIPFKFTLAIIFIVVPIIVIIIWGSKIIKFLL